MLMLLLLTPLLASAQTSAIKAGRLIDPEAGTATPNSVILVDPPCLLSNPVPVVFSGISIYSGGACLQDCIRTGTNLNAFSDEMMADWWHVSAGRSDSRESPRVDGWPREDEEVD